MVTWLHKNVSALSRLLAYCWATECIHYANRANNAIKGSRMHVVISSVPTRCVYLLPTRNRQLVRVCFWTSGLDCLLVIADLHDIVVCHMTHTPLTSLLMFARTIPSTGSLLQSYDPYYTYPLTGPTGYLQLVPSRTIITPDH